MKKSDTSSNSQKNDNETEFDINQDDAYNDDVVIEEEVSDTGQVKKLREKLKACVAEKQQYLDGWQRAKADFANAQKAFESQKKEYVSYASEELIEELLPVIDSFDMAISNKEVWESVDENWRVGVEYIYSQLLSVLEGRGVRQIDPLGDIFDPNQHTSIEQIAADDPKDDHKITKVVQKGYVLKDRQLRSPKVIVAVFGGDRSDS